MTDTLKESYDRHTAEGMGGARLLRAMMDDTGMTLDTIINELKASQMADKQLRTAANNMRLNEKKKQERQERIEEFQAKRERCEQQKAEEEAAMIRYMEHITPIHKRLRELHAQRKAIDTELRNLTATLRQLLEVAEHGEDAK